MKTDINRFSESHPKESKSTQQGSHHNEEKKGHSAKYTALPISRFKIRDLKHLKDERTHNPFKEEEEAQPVFLLQ